GRGRPRGGVRPPRAGRGLRGGRSEGRDLKALAGQGADQSGSYLKERFRRARYRASLPSSTVTSSLTTSATRRSRSDPAAVSIAAWAAFSHDSVLVPTSSVTRYTLSAMCSPSRHR